MTEVGDRVRANWGGDDIPFVGVVTHVVNASVTFDIDTDQEEEEEERWVPPDRMRFVGNTGEQNLRGQSKGASVQMSSCPFIYRYDSVSARSHTQIVFQVRKAKFSSSLRMIREQFLSGRRTCK